MFVCVCSESTQATEPASLCALVHNSQHVVLLGDHYQLPPTVTSSEAQKGPHIWTLVLRSPSHGISLPFFSRRPLGELVRKDDWHGDRASHARNPVPVSFCDFTLEQREQRERAERAERERLGGRGGGGGGKEGGDLFNA